MKATKRDVAQWEKTAKAAQRLGSTSADLRAAAHRLAGNGQRDLAEEMDGAADILDGAHFITD